MPAKGTRTREPHSSRVTPDDLLRRARTIFDGAVVAGSDLMLIDVNDTAVRRIEVTPK